LNLKTLSRTWPDPKTRWVILALLKGGIRKKEKKTGRTEGFKKKKKTQLERNNPGTEKKHQLSYEVASLKEGKRAKEEETARGSK